MRAMLVAALVVSVELFPAGLSAQSDNGAGSGLQTTTAARVIPLEARPDRWRYRWHQGYWWYYTPQQTWLIYENQAWKPFLMPPPAPAAAIPQPRPARSPADRPGFGVDSP